jgi:hypothetical protein
MVAMVVGLEGALAGKRFMIGSESITFGRGDENDVVLTNLLTSRVHAELRYQDGGWNAASGACRTTRRCEPTWSGFPGRPCTHCW